MGSCLSCGKGKGVGKGSGKSTAQKLPESDPDASPGELNGPGKPSPLAEDDDYQINSPDTDDPLATDAEYRNELPNDSTPAAVTPSGLKDNQKTTPLGSPNAYQKEHSVTTTEVTYSHRPELIGNGETRQTTKYEKTTSDTTYIAAKSFSVKTHDTPTERVTTFTEDVVESSKPSVPPVSSPVSSQASTQRFSDSTPSPSYPPQSLILTHISDQTSDYHNGTAGPVSPPASTSVKVTDSSVTTPRSLWNGDPITGANLQVPDVDTFRKQVLVAHNRYRQNHGAPQLELCSSLTKQAQEWADKGARDGDLVRRPDNEEDPKFGENLWTLSVSGPFKVSGENPVQTWYEENVFHDYRRPTSLGAAHFTQVVWKASKEVGVGVAVTPDHRHIYVVTNYIPPGNRSGQYRVNVGQPK